MRYGVSAFPTARRRALHVVILGLVGLAALVGAAMPLPAAWAQEELFVANFGAPSVTVYPRTWTVSNTAPARTVSGGSAGLNLPVYLAVTSAEGILTLSEWAQIGGWSACSSWGVCWPCAAVRPCKCNARARTQRPRPS